MSRRLVAAVALAVLLGAILGWAYRRWTHPLPDGRAEEAARKLKGAVERMTH